MAQCFEHMLPKNESLTAMVGYGPSLPCRARGLEHLIMARGVSWSTEHTEMKEVYLLACWWEGNNASRQSQPVTQAPELPVPAGCISAFSYCRTGLKISWHLLMCIC